MTDWVKNALLSSLSEPDKEIDLRKPGKLVSNYLGVFTLRTVRCKTLLKAREVTLRGWVFTSNARHSLAARNWYRCRLSEGCS